MRVYLRALALVLLLPALCRAEGSVYVVPIEGTIEGGLAAFISRVMEEAEAEDVSAVIFEIDTPGGALDAALVIRDAILYSDVKTIAFINPRAISAGALISLATRHIVMVEGGTIGAATAVDMQGKKASEKVISYFRNEMKATAEKTGRPPKLAEAMVDEDVDIADLAPKGKLLTLTSTEAVATKIAETMITATGDGDKLQAVLAHYELDGARITRQSVNWSEQVVRWLTHPIVASLLMSLGFLGLIFEIQSPGWGVGGTIGLICLGLFFGSHLLVQLADWTEVLLFLGGVILVIADLFFIVGFGVLAVPGVILMIAGLFLSLMGRHGTLDLGVRGHWCEAPAYWRSSRTVVIACVMLKMLPRTSAWKWLVLQAEERRDAGFIATGQHDGLLGKEGVAFTPLRPSGTGLIDGRRVNVAADGEFIERDSRITVIEVEGNRIVVRKTEVNGLAF